VRATRDTGGSRARTPAGKAGRVHAVVAVM